MKSFPPIPRTVRLGVLLTLLALAGAAWAETVTIAVVRDGPAPGRDLAARVREELSSHLPSGTTVEWKTDPAFDAGWDPARARAALEAALADPEAAVVLAVGAMTTVAAASGDLVLPKPVVSAYVQRSNLFPLSLDEDRKDNFSFTVLPRKILREIETFRTLVPFERLHVLVSPTLLAAFGDPADAVARLESELGFELAVGPADAGAPDGAEAAVLAATPRLSRDERRGLLAELARRGIPTWSLLGHRDVEDGALAALTPDTTDQVVRRVALNLNRILRGAATAELPVVLTADSKLLINAETARQVGYVPDPERRLFASFLHPEALEDPAEDLVLEDALGMAEEGNTELSIEDAVVQSARSEAAIARSFLLPQIAASLSHSETDATLALPPEGTRGAVTLRQLVYDDGTRSASRAARRLVTGSEEEREAVRLDVLAAAGSSFLVLAQAEALYEVELQNLRLTEDFLELARLREEVGHSGRAEIVRWEANLAERRSALFTVQEQVEAARIALNQVLGLDQDRRWHTRTIEVDRETFSFADGRLDAVFKDHTNRPRLRDALVDLALGRAPEALALRELIAAQQIQLGQKRRAYYVPSVFADVTYSAEIDGGDGPVTFDDDDSTTFSLVVSYPLFEGGRRAHEVTRAESGLETLKRQLRLVEERVEQRTRTALRRIESSFPRLKFSRQAAESAGENLRLVEDQYGEGLVNVTDLLSAQAQKFAADQFATLALYEHLLDLVELQRALAWFVHEQDAASLDAFVASIRTEAGQ